MDKTDRLCVDSAGQCIYVFMYTYIFSPIQTSLPLSKREQQDEPTGAVCIHVSALCVDVC